MGKTEREIELEEAIQKISDIATGKIATHWTLMEIRTTCNQALNKQINRKDGIV